MKKLSILFAAMIVCVSAVIGQNKVTKDNVVGTWKMKIEMDEVIAELEEEADDAETILAEVILKTVSGTMQGVMDRVEIYITLERDGDALVLVEVFDEEAEEDDSEWYIRNGRLYIKDNLDDDFDWDSDDGWYMKDGVLVLDNDDDDDVQIYMIKVDE